MYKRKALDPRYRKLRRYENDRINVKSILIKRITSENFLIEDPRIIKEKSFDISNSNVRNDCIRMIELCKQHDITKMINSYIRLKKYASEGYLKYLKNSEIHTRSV